MNFTKDDFPSLPSKPIAKICFFLLHNLIQQNLNSGSAQVQTLLVVCRRFAMKHGKKLCDILKLSKFPIFYEKWNNSWTKSRMKMKFQVSLYLIIPQSFEFCFFLKKVLILWILRKICCSAWLAIKNTREQQLKFCLNENKAYGYF